MTTPKKIGEMNGRWAILFRVSMVVIPLLVPWAAWTTVTVIENRAAVRQVGDIMHRIDALVQCHQKDMELIRQQINDSPPAVWRERILSLEQDARQNAVDHTSILVSLEQIKTKMGIPSGDK